MTFQKLKDQLLDDYLLFINNVHLTRNDAYSLMGKIDIVWNMDILEIRKFTGKNYIDSKGYASMQSYLINYIHP